MKKVMSKALLLLLTVTLLFVMSSCGLSGNKNSGNDTNNGTNNGGYDDEFSTDAVWDNGGTVNVYSRAEIYSAIGETDLFGVLQNEAGINVRWYSADNTTLANSIIVGETESELSKAAYRRLERISSNSNDPNISNWLIYAQGTSLALAYNSDFAFHEVIEAFVSNYGGLTRFAPSDGVVLSGEVSGYEYVKELRDERINSSLNALTSKFGESTVEALKNLYSIYSYKDYIWLADLWDPETGGFYFSNSARNTEGFLPDLESTAQAFQYLENAGILDRDALTYHLPEEMRDKIANFVINMQSDADGYFYHPQWGSTVGTSRKGRDLSWATGLLGYLKVQPLYDTPDGKMKGTIGAAGTVTPTSSSLTGSLSMGRAMAVSKVVSVSTSNLPSYLQSVSKFQEYIINMDIRYDSYGDGNTLNAQVNQIINADRALWLKQNPGSSSSSYTPANPAKDGYIDFLVEHLASIQDPNTGLFEAKNSDNDAYYRVDGLMKIATLYSYFKHEFPNAKQGFKSCVDVILIPGDHEHVCSVYNPWITMKLMLGTVKNYGSYDEYTALRQSAVDIADKLLKNTLQKLAVLKMENGGFSYFVNIPCNNSQGAKVACATEREADVNALGLASSGVIVNIAEVLGFNSIPLFSQEDFTVFLNYLVSLGKIEKDVAPPREAITFEHYEPSAEDIASGVASQPDDYVSCVVNDRDMLDGKYKWFGSSVVPNPVPNADNGDLVLKTNVYTYPDEEKNKANVMSATIFELTEDAVGANCYVFESDILIMDGPANVIAQMAFTSKWSDNAFGVSFYGYEGADGKKYVKLYDRFPGKDGVTNSNLVDGIPMGEWFNLRIELYRLPYVDENGKVQYDVKAQIFLNNDYIGESDAGYILSGEQNYATTAIHQFRYNHYRYWDSETYFNNCYCYSEVKNYEAVPPAVSSLTDGTYTFDLGENDKVSADLNSNGATSEIIKVPEKEGYILDKALTVKSSAGETDVLSVINDDSVVGYNMISFGADLRFNYGTGASQAINIVLGGVGTEHTAYYLNITYDALTRQISISDTSNLGDGSKVNIGSRNNKWFSLRIDYYKISNTEILAFIYIDDDLVYVSDNYANTQYHAVPISSGYVTSDGVYLSNGINSLEILLDNSFNGSLALDNVRFEKAEQEVPVVNESSYNSRYHADSEYEEDLDDKYEYLDFENGLFENGTISISGINKGVTEGGGAAQIAKTEDKNGVLTNAFIVNGVRGDGISMYTGDIIGAERFVFVANIKPEFSSNTDESIELILGSTGSDSYAAYRLVLRCNASDGMIYISDASSSNNRGEEVNTGARNSEWISLRIEYYKISQNEILALTYVDGELIYVSDNVATDKNRFGTAWEINGSYTTHDGGTVAKGLNAVKIAFSGSDSTRVTIDNVVVCKEDGEVPVLDETDYTSRFHADSTDPGEGAPTSPDSNQDFSGNLPGGTWH